jgi:hypothetical protein
VLLFFSFGNGGVCVSYIRAAWPYTFVDGDSDDYIFGSEENGVPYIETYGGPSNNTIVELLCEHLTIRTGDAYDRELKKILIERLAEELGVKLRLVPFTEDEVVKGMEDRIKRDNHRFGSDDA